MTVAAARDTFDNLAADHRAAVDEFVRRASAIPADRWKVPRAPEKWSPAQETKHVALYFSKITEGMNGAPHLRMRVKGLRRLIIRWFYFGRIMRSGRIPVAVRAPREVRPPDDPGTQNDLLSELREASARFEAALRERQSVPVTMMHPYFGGLDARETLRFAAIHTRHHAAFLPTS